MGFGVGLISVALLSLLSGTEGAGVGRPDGVPPAAAVNGQRAAVEAGSIPAPSLRNLFLPLVPRPTEPKGDQRDTAPVVGGPAVAAPVPPPEDASRPEDAMFITGIVRDGDDVRVLVEDRRTGKVKFLRRGDALGEGVIIDIGKYDITVKEWAVVRKIPLGYSVSGKRDTYRPPPSNVRSGGEAGRRVGAEGQPRLPPWPGREVWRRWTPRQRREYLRRRREAFLRLREWRARHRQR